MNSKTSIPNMKNIFIIGAGLSSSSLLRYLTNNSTKENWQLRVCDQDGDKAKSKVKNCTNAEGFALDALNPALRQEHIVWADLVISMLPARFHIDIAKDCIKHKQICSLLLTFLMR
jgi:saccharopine dehydrogenase-like NADP-dependent oxidoreductase